MEILDKSVEYQAKTYPCCPDEIYPSLEFSVTFKRTMKFSKGKFETAHGGEEEV